VSLETLEDVAFAGGQSFALAAARQILEPRRWSFGEAKTSIVDSVNDHGHRDYSQ